MRKRMHIETMKSDSKLRAGWQQLPGIHDSSRQRRKETETAARGIDRDIRHCTADPLLPALAGTAGEPT